MLAALGKIAQERGLRTVEARYIRSARNQPALLFLESVGLPFQSVRTDTLAFRFPADFAVCLKYEPPGAPIPTAAAAPQAPTAGRARIAYARIASTLRTAEQVLEAVRAQTPLAGSAATPSEPPRTGLEGQLCRIWSEMLNCGPVGIHDNFFDLGGHSLLAVQLLSRLKEELGVELSLEVVYGADFTVAELAKAIELRELELAGGDQYAALLAEIESLSDEEVHELLAKESAEAGE